MPKAKDVKLTTTTRSKSKTKETAAPEQKNVKKKSAVKIEAAPQPTRKSRSVTPGKSAKKTSSISDETPIHLYTEDTILAFIDKEDVENGLQRIALAKVSTLFIQNSTNLFICLSLTDQ
jgi:hypothetical protein